jgi:hypothetical protein
VATDSLVYSLIQIVHNLNAALVLGVPLLGLWHGFHGIGPVRSLRLLAGLWALQGITGAAFGAASYWLYGALPDLHPIAFGALSVKVACVGAGLGLCAWLLIRSPHAQNRAAWIGLAVLGGTALSAAAILRWYA